MLLSEWNMKDALEVAKEEGVEIGVEKGIGIGTEKGIKLKAEQDAMAMKAKGFHPSLIAEITRLSVAEIESI
jgi:cobalamin biosynthesis protein CbiD